MTLSKTCSNALLTSLFALILPFLLLFSCGTETPSPQPAKTTYTVTFNSGEGTSVAALQVEAGENVAKPADPTRTGYTFDGWYKEATYTTLFKFTAGADSRVTEAITLYAKWAEIPKFTVTFNSGEGTSVVALQVEVGENVAKPTDPTRGGYTFDGWYKEATYTTLFKFTSKAEADRVTEAITLYAKWTEIPKFTVTFNSGEGTSVATFQVEEGKNVAKPIDPTRGGYTFDGWYKEATYTTLFKFTGEAEADRVTEAITLYAKWTEIPKFTVTFNSGEGSAVAALQVEEGENVAKPTDPTRTGYTFDGWYKEATYITLFKFTGEAEADRVTEAITLYAKWTEIPKFTVTFNSGEGSAVDALQVEAGKNVAKPTDPTRGGYGFVGWYKEATYTTLFEFIGEAEADTITEAITLYAKWTEIPKFTVTFNSREGTSVAALQIEEGENVAKPIDPTRGGYIFDGWYKEATYTTLFEFIGEAEADRVTEAITLYAKWTEIPKFTVTFNSGEGSAVDALQVEAGKNVAKPTDPTRGGYGFVGWYKEATYTTLFKFTGEAEADRVTEAITLYAKWTEIPKFTVTFNSGEGSAVDALQVEEGKNVAKPTDPTRDNYNFDGWYKEDTYTTLFKFTGEAGADTVTEAITLYAKWTEIPKFTVTFNSGEGTSLVTLQVEEGKNVAKPIDPTRTGYTFDGWYKEATYITLFKFTGEAEADRVTEAITLYAKWTEIPKFTVTFNSGEGSAVDALQVEEGKNVAKPTDPTRGGYTFDGWYKEATYTTLFEFIGEAEADRVTEAITLYAKWTEIPKFTVTFNSGEGSAVDALQVEEGKNVAKPTDPTRGGYTFDGWYKEATYTTLFKFTGEAEADRVTEAITLYAKWTEIPKFTVTFNSGEGSAVDALQVEAGKNVAKPTDPTRRGYTFDGWYKEATYTTLFEFIGEAEADAITEAITLYAKWTEIPKFTVTFNSGEGTSVAALQIEEGENVAKPTDPTRGGYIFDGWYKEATYTTLFKFTGEAEADRVTEAITLYAKWTEIPKFTVTFNSGEGSAVDALQVEEGKNVAKPTDPTRGGYTFDGWYKEATYTTLFKFIGETEADRVTEAITLYAKWTEIPKFTVTFNSGEGTSLVTLQVEEGKNVAKPIDPTRTGYTFDGWYKEATYITLFKFTGEAEADRVTEAITLYAKWTEIPKFTVTFNSGEGTSLVTLQVEEGKNVAKPIDPTRTGYTFDGWYKEATYITLFKFTGEAEADRVTEAITLYAKWTEIPKFTVTFNSGEGTSLVTLQVEEGKNVAKPIDPTRTGYTFDGWYKEATYITLFKFTGEAEADRVTEAITLYANWEVVVSYTVTFDSQGGSTVDVLQVEAEKKAIKPTDPTRAGYTFAGWYKEGDLNVFNFETEIITGDITLYATWEVVVSYTVTFDSQGGSTVAALQVEAGEKATKPTDPTRGIYTFVGWYKDETLRTIFDFETEKITGDTKLYVKWEAVPRTKAELKMFVDAGIEEKGDNANLNYINTEYMEDMSEIFKDKNNFNGDISGWNVAAVRNMSRMFYDARVFNGDISKWDVSNVVDMNWMFYNAKIFNGGIGSWNVVAVTDMRYMFFRANAFNQDLENWDVAISVAKQAMFTDSGLTEDAQPSWYLPKLSFVTDVEGINTPPIYLLVGERVKNVPFLSSRENHVFQYWSASKEGGEAFDFNQDITTDITLYAKWEPVQTVVVTFKRLGDRGPKEFLGEQHVVKDQPLSLTLFEKSPYALIGLFIDSDATQVFALATLITNGMTLYVRWVPRPKNKEELIQFIDAELNERGNETDLNFIDTQLITDMSNLFANKTSFNGDISGWNVVAVKDMSYMFSSASAFNGDISGWNVVAVGDMKRMFSNASAFNGDISGWNVATVTNMNWMFANTSAFKGDISGWNVAAVRDMSYMFYNASVFNGNISGWNVAAVKDMRYMFFRANVFNRDISAWDVAAVTDMNWMFAYASAFNQDLENWNVATSVNKQGMFRNSGINSDNNNMPSWY